MSDLEMLDLDALMPQAITVKYDGQEISVQPPKTRHLLRLSALGTKLQKPEALSDEDIEKLEYKMTEIIYECIPQLRGKPLVSMQLMALMQLLARIGTPPENAELEKRGITMDSPKDE